MLIISIAFTLFALMAGMLLLAKAKKEELGKLFIWGSYLVIVVSLTMLIFQSTRGIMRMAWRKDCSSEHCMQGMMNGGCDRGGCMMMQHGWMRRGHAGRMEMEEEMEMCKTKNDSSCCQGEKKHGCEMEEETEKEDSGAKSK